MATEQIEPNAVPAGLMPSAETTPGRLLKAEREKLGLTESQVSEQLHITMHYVRSLEADLYEKLPGKVFARGYLKSYALLVKLNPQTVIGLFDDLMAEKEGALQATVRRVAAQRQRDRNLPWLVFSLVAFILGFTGLWVFNHFFVVIDENTYRNQTPPGMAIAAGNDAEAASIEPGLTAPDRSAASAYNEQTSQALLLGVTEAQEHIASQVPGQIVEIVAPGSDVLQIRFSGESWVEVADDSSLPLYRDIRVAGDLLQITGRAPFNVLLGDAPFASIQFNGVTIDLSDNIRIDNSARLVVGL